MNRKIVSHIKRVNNCWIVQNEISFIKSIDIENVNEYKTNSADDEAWGMLVQKKNEESIWYRYIDVLNNGTVCELKNKHDRARAQRHIHILISIRDTSTPHTFTSMCQMWESEIESAKKNLK